MSLEESIARVVEETVRRVVREELGAASSTGRRQLLSKREAARMLGVDRGVTLSALIDEGRIRTVEMRGRVCIPRSDVERIVSEGVPSPSPSGRRRPGVAGGAAALRSLKLDEL